MEFEGLYRYIKVRSTIGTLHHLYRVVVALRSVSVSSSRSRSPIVGQDRPIVCARDLALWLISTLGTIIFHPMPPPLPRLFFSRPRPPPLSSSHSHSHCGLMLVLVLTLQDWHGIFLRFDRDNSGTIDRKELHAALLGFGFSLPPEMVRRLEKKFAPPLQPGQEGTRRGISFDRFLLACVTVKHYTEAFRR